MEIVDIVLLKLCQKPEVWDGTMLTNSLPNVATEQRERYFPGGEGAPRAPQSSCWLSLGRRKRLRDEWFCNRDDSSSNCQEKGHFHFAPTPVFTFVLLLA